MLTTACCSVLKNVLQCAVQVPAALPIETPAYEQSIIIRALYIRRKEPYVLAENSPVYSLKEPCVFAKRAPRIRPKQHYVFVEKSRMYSLCICWKSPVSLPNKPYISTKNTLNHKISAKRALYLLSIAQCICWNSPVSKSPIPLSNKPCISERYEPYVLNKKNPGGLGECWREVECVRGLLCVGVCCVCMSVGLFVCVDRVRWWICRIVLLSAFAKLPNTEGTPNLFAYGVGWLRIVGSLKL